MDKLIKQALDSAKNEVVTKYNLEYDPAKLFRELSRTEAKDAFKDKQFDKLFDFATRINYIAGTINVKKADNTEIKRVIKAYKLEIDQIHDKDSVAYLLQWLLPTEALYFYRNSQYHNAEKAILESIENIDTLIKDNQLTSFLFRLVLQNWNLVSLYFKQGHYEKAFNTAISLLDYLFNNRAGYISGLSFLNEKLWGEMEFLREYNAYSFFQLTCEKLSEIKRSNYKEYKRSFKVLKDTISPLNIFTEERYVIDKWLSIEMNYLNNQIELFLASFTEFFEEEISEVFNFLRRYLIDSFQDLLRRNTCISQDKEHYIKILTELSLKYPGKSDRLQTASTV